MVKEAIVGGLSYLNPFHENFFLRIALVPREGFWAEQADLIMDRFDEKLPIVGQVIGFFDDLINVDYDSDIPAFNISFTGKWGNYSGQIVDFSYFSQYRDLVFTFIRGIAWFWFLKKLLSRMPSVIYK